MKAMLTSFLAAAMLAGGAFALPAAADDDDTAEMRALSTAAGLISPEQAIEKALAAKPGTAIDADLDRKLGKYYYEVEVIDAQGVEWEVHLDATTGEVKRVKRDADLF
jgi:uncharacterized membrane protein YkoI